MHHFLFKCELNWSVFSNKINIVNNMHLFQCIYILCLFNYPFMPYTLTKKRQTLRILTKHWKNVTLLVQTTITILCSDFFICSPFLSLSTYIFSSKLQPEGSFLKNWLCMSSVKEAVQQLCMLLETKSKSLFYFIIVHMI